MESFQIDDSSGIPVWVQVRKRLIYEIVSGKFAPGEQLPTMRELAVLLDINYNTVSKVYHDLEREGFIITKRGKGTYAADLHGNKNLALDNKVELLAEEFVDEALDFGLNEEEIVMVVKKLIKQRMVMISGKGEIADVRVLEITGARIKGKPLFSSCRALRS